MNTFTKRSLATAAVAGLVVLGGAPVASADDSSQQNRQESVLGGPIELGGIDLGSERDSSSSRSDSSTDRDRGDARSDRSSQQDSSSTDFGLGIGGTTVDPRAGLSNDSSSTSQDDGDDTTSDRDTDLAGSLGIQSEGLSGFVEQDTSSAEQGSTSDEDEDGTEQERSTSNDERSVGGGFDTGGIELAPQGSLSDDRASASQDEGEENLDRGRSILELAAPFSYEGGEYVLDFSSLGTEEQQSTRGDEDGTETDRSSSEEEDSQTFGGQIEGGQGDPGLQLDSEDLQRSDD